MSNEPPFDDDDLINDFYEEPDEYPDEFDVPEEYMEELQNNDNYNNINQEMNQQTDAMNLNQENEVRMDSEEQDVPSHVSFDIPANITNDTAGEDQVKSHKPDLYSFER